MTRHTATRSFIRSAVLDTVLGRRGMKPMSSANKSRWRIGQAAAAVPAEMIASACSTCRSIASSDGTSKCKHPTLGAHNSRDDRTGGSHQFECTMFLHRPPCSASHPPREMRCRQSRRAIRRHSEAAQACATPLRSDHSVADSHRPCCPGRQERVTQRVCIGVRARPYRRCSHQTACRTVLRNRRYLLHGPRLDCLAFRL